MSSLSNKDLIRLQSWDTPTICNALDIASPERRLEGFTSKQLVSVELLDRYARTLKPHKLLLKANL